MLVVVTIPYTILLQQHLRPFFLSHQANKKISCQISSVTNKKVAQNEAILRAIIKCIILCGQQNIPLRGKTDESSNFMALLHFRAETDKNLKIH